MVMSELDHGRRRALRAIGAGALVVGGLAGSTAARGGGLQRELAEVRSATAKYNDPANAYADGYIVPDPHADPLAPLPLEDVVDEGHAVCGMGFHFINPANIGKTNPTEPQVLAYGVDDEGNLILGAVEYIIPNPISDGNPDVFENDEGTEEWHPGPLPDAQSLHAWVHTHNPEGVFHHTNPRKQFHPEGCIPIHDGGPEESS